MLAQSAENAAAAETAYDGVGRAYQTRTTLVLATTKYSSGKYQYRAPAPKPSLASMTSGDDLVIAMSHNVYSGEQMIETHLFEDNHDDAVSATRGIDLTANDDYVRRSVFSWNDAADRTTAMADYGSGDTTAGAGTWKYATIPTRSGTAPTASSETALVTLYSYNADTGAQETVTDPKGTKTKSFVDRLGRNTYTAENYDNFNASTEANTGDGSDKSKDRVTKFVYNAVSQTKLVAMDANADGNLSDNQTTTYLFEDAVSARRTTNEIYPDSSDTTSAGTDQVKIAYNVDGSLASRTDQRGTVIDYTYTNRRELDLTKVTTLGGSTDGHVRAIKQSYDDMGRVEKVTSTANSDGTGTVRNEVQYEYNDLSQVTKSYQSHEGAVNTGTSLKVQYTYDATAVSSVFTRQHRLESVTYPNGRVVFYDYDSSNADYPSSRLSRVRNIRQTNSTGTILAQYDYNGAGGGSPSPLAGEGQFCSARFLRRGEYMLIERIVLEEDSRCRPRMDRSAPGNCRGLSILG